MAFAGSHDGFPWEHQQLSKSRMSSVSDISSPTPMDETNRFSAVSLPTPLDQEVTYVNSIPLPSDEASTSHNLSTQAAITDAYTATASPKLFSPFSWHTDPAYESIAQASSVGRKSTLKRIRSKRFSMRRKNSKFGGASIPEEMDMELLSEAAQMGAVKPSRLGIDEDDEIDVLSPLAPGCDLSSLTGPMGYLDDNQLEELHQQELHGILTGGLGAGLKAEAVLKSTDLFANAPTITEDTTSWKLSHSVTRKMSSFTGYGGKQPSVRDLGQSEANRRNEIIEVIMEEAPVDLSTIEGGNQPKTDFRLDDETAKRKSAMRMNDVEIFYPHPNWLPFSMRWPYLSALVIFSVVLAAAQEYVFQKSEKGFLYQFQKPSDINTWDYFSFKYLPTVVAVAFGVLWQLTEFEVKRLEAFHQLGKDGGALAAESIDVDYVTFFSFLRPIQALHLKHHAVAISSIATLLAVSLVPTLQSASVLLTPDRATRELDPTGDKQIRISGLYSRLLSAVLVIVAMLGCILLWQLQTRRSGLIADVKGIAGLAAMANRSHILMDFKDMDTASPGLIHNRLKDHRYILRNSSLASDDHASVTRQEKDKYDQEQPSNPHPFMLRLGAGISLVSGIVLFMGLIPIFLFTDASVINEEAPWFITGLAVCIKLAWGTLETDVRMMEPFYILSNRHASPEVLTLDYSSMPFGWMPIRAFLNGHLLVGLVGFGSVLAEILTVCAISFGGVEGHVFTKTYTGMNGTGVDADVVFSSDETFITFWGSFTLAQAILLFLCLVAIVVYFRRRHTFIPRQPNTIASVLAYIHQSKMLYDFVGTEKMDNDQMVQHLVGIGKTYGLGWFTGRDGAIHCGVDEEELVSRYKYGNDARKATMPWTSNWQDY